MSGAGDEPVKRPVSGAGDEPVKRPMSGAGDEPVLERELVSEGDDAARRYALADARLAAADAASARADAAAMRAAAKEAAAEASAARARDAAVAAAADERRVDEARRVLDADRAALVVDRAACDADRQRLRLATDAVAERSRLVAAERRQLDDDRAELRRAADSDERLLQQHASMRDDAAAARRGAAGAIGAAESRRVLGRLWDLVDDALRFGGYEATQEALRAERMCERRPPALVDFLSEEAEAETYLAAAVSALDAALEAGDRALFERRWADVVPRLRGSAALAKVRLKIGGLWALAALRARLPRDEAPFPATPEEYDALDVFEALLQSDDAPHQADEALLPLLALPQLKKPWLQPQLGLLLRDDAAWAAAWAAVRGELRDVTQGTALEDLPDLVVLFRAYERWECALGVSALEAARAARTNGRAAVELLVVCAWLLHDLEEAGAALASRAPSKAAAAVAASKGGAPQDAALRIAHVRARLSTLRDTLRATGAFDDGETAAPPGALSSAPPEAPAPGAPGALVAAALWMPPPLDGRRLRAALLERPVDRAAPFLAALAQRLALPSASNGGLLRASTLQLLVAADVLSIRDVPRVDADGILAPPGLVALLVPAPGRQSSTRIVTSNDPRALGDSLAHVHARRLVAALIARLAAGARGRAYLALHSIASTARPSRSLFEAAAAARGNAALDVVSALLCAACASEPDAATAFAAVALQRLSLEDAAAARLMHIGGLDALASAAQRLCGLGARHRFVADRCAAALVNAAANARVQRLHDAEFHSGRDLPIGWVAGGDPVYYFSYSTGESSWDAPENGAEPLGLCQTCVRLLVDERDPATAGRTSHVARSLLGTLYCLTAAPNTRRAVAEALVADLERVLEWERSRALDPDGDAPLIRELHCVLTRLEDASDAFLTPNGAASDAPDDDDAAWACDTGDVAALWPTADHLDGGEASAAEAWPAEAAAAAAEAPAPAPGEFSDGAVLQSDVAPTPGLRYEHHLREFYILQPPPPL
ncbi:hypothetical protein M885DRAFT_508518 [Pelagophyceae sp. CCMP2097]|nr:hypothetical protein M885DRAFT_508518 [Pelagophyceae sp. CCMP2097]